MFFVSIFKCEITERSLTMAIGWGPPPVHPNLGRMSRALRVFPCHNWVTSSRDTWQASHHKEHQPSRLTGARTWHRLQGGGCEMRRDVRTIGAAIGQLGPYSALIGCWDTGARSEDVLDGCKMTTQGWHNTLLPVSAECRHLEWPPSEHPSRLSDVMWSEHTFSQNQSEYDAALQSAVTTNILDMRYTSRSTVRESDKQTQCKRQNIFSFWARGCVNTRKGGVNMIVIFVMNSVYYSDDSAFKTHTDFGEWHTHGYWPGFDQPHICLWSSQ